MGIKSSRNIELELCHKSNKTLWYKNAHEDRFQCNLTTSLEVGHMVLQLITKSTPPSLEFVLIVKTLNRMGGGKIRFLPKSPSC